ncbi:hypothetical protein ACIBQ1_07320 [Nonomuraea sp. NPDC050153]|uniref:hypothetical protein n=1 Tax=Nonomuraea sp. NPDC050153 TaxID=3364359 RepID=UPI0037A32813
MADYPPRNPFPARGIASGEETSLPTFLSSWPGRACTAVLPSVSRAERLARAYLDGFPRDGGLSCLYGAHGIGKTHAARHMMAFVQDERPEAVQLYLRFHEDDFVAAYRRLVSQLSQTLLADLSLGYLGTIESDLAARAVRRASHAEGMAPDRLGPDLVETGEVLEEQAKEIAAVAGDGPRFQRALTYLIRPDYSEAAYDWLCGRPISPGAAAAIGVDGRIDDPLTCRYGLQLLATLVTRGGRPFVIVLDQCEKFLLVDGEPVAANIGLLQGLVEMIPEASGLLLLVTSETGWEVMPQDLRQRLGAGACHLLPLTPDQAELVLSTYIGAARQAPHTGIQPFTDMGLRELLRHSGGNIRLLLQLAWASFEAAAPRLSSIDAEVVSRASARRSRSPDLASLAKQIETELRAEGLSAERVEENGRLASFQVPDGREPRAVIRLSEAVFFDDEVANASEVLESGPRCFTALLVTGYVSPPVLDTLREAIPVVLVADGSAAFARELHGLVERIAAIRGPAGQPDTLDEALLARLEELSVERRGEAAALRRELAELAERLERAERKSRSDWPARRDELRERIAEARDARAAADWEEFRRSRADVVERRGTLLGRLKVAMGTTAALVIAALASAPIQSIPLTLTLMIGAAGTAGGTLYVRGRLGSIKVSHPRSSLQSPRDLDRLVRQTPPDANSPDPVGRYAHVLRTDPDQAYQELVDAMLAEPLPLVRQAIGRRLAVAARSPSDCVPEVLRGQRDGAPEMLLLLARRQRHAESGRPRVLRDLAPELRVLVALANPDALELAAGAVSPHPAELALEALGVRGSQHPLAQGFRGGAVQSLPVEIPPSALRATAHLLSPLERNGLGAYDWLPMITKVDDLYLFFEELLYYQETFRSTRHKS